MKCPKCKKETDGSCREGLIDNILADIEHDSNDDFALLQANCAENAIRLICDKCDHSWSLWSKYNRDFNGRIISSKHTFLSGGNE